MGALASPYDEYRKFFSIQAEMLFSIMFIIFKERGPYRIACINSFLCVMAKMPQGLFKTYSDFIYHAPREAVVASDARISGETLFDEQKGMRSNLASFSSGFASFHLLATLALAFFLFFLFRERTEEILLDAAENLWQRVLRGLLLFLVVPLAGAFLFFTAVGIPLGLALIALYFAGLVFSAAYAGVLLGVFLERPLFRRSAFPLSARTVFVGVALLALLGVIPYLGFVAVLLFTLASFGSLGTIGWRHLKQMR